MSEKQVVMGAAILREIHPIVLRASVRLLKHLDATKVREVLVNALICELCAFATDLGFGAPEIVRAVAHGMVTSRSGEP